MMRIRHGLLCLFLSLSISAFSSIAQAPVAHADENILGYIKGAETLPKGSWEFYQFFTLRNGKGTGTYNGFDLKAEVEHGVTDRLTLAGSLQFQSSHTQGLLIDAYIPQDMSTGLKPSGIEVGLKYNFLSPAKDDFGLAAYYSIDASWLDSHSGQRKNSYSFDLSFLFQKYFLEGELIWVGNLGTEATHATRFVIDDLPDGFEWPTTPEMEIEFKVGSGLSYRVLPSWYLGVETIYETEFETEVNQERWSIFAGPTVHYGSQKWWATFTWFPQLAGGPEPYAGQANESLHLVEKTESEVRLKLGLNF